MKAAQVNLTVAVLIGIFLAVSLNNTSLGFIPQDETVTIALLTGDKRDVNVGTEVDLTVIITNFTNETISNITVFFPIPSGMVFLRTPFEDFNGEDVNYTRIKDNPVMLDLSSNLNIPLNYLNVTASNFTLNFDNIEKFNSLSFGLRVNITSDDRTILGISSDLITMEYYDHFGDPLTVKVANNVDFNVATLTTNELVGYFPELTIDDINYFIFLWIGLGITAAAIIGRMLYRKRPIE